MIVRSVKRVSSFNLTWRTLIEGAHGAQLRRLRQEVHETIAFDILVALGALPAEYEFISLRAP